VDDRIIRPPSRPVAPEHVTAEIPSVVQPSPTEREGIPPTRRPAPSMFGYPPIEDASGQVEALNHITGRLQRTVSAAEEAEDRREGEYQQQEEERMRIFLDHEAQRNEEARQRAEAIWRELESRLAALPPAPPPAAPAAEKPEPSEETAEIESIKSVAQQAASQHASDVMEMIRLEREEFGREREALAEERSQLLEQLRTEKDHVIEEKDQRINTLEQELTQLRADFEAERLLRVREDTELRERERQERMEQDEAMRMQLGDLTNLVQNTMDKIEEKKATSDARYEEKAGRRQGKDAQNIEFRDMIQKIHEDMEANQARCEDDKREVRETLERVIDDLQRQNADQRDLLQSLSESKF